MGAGQEERSAGCTTPSDIVENSAPSFEKQLSFSGCVLEGSSAISDDFQKESVSGHQKGKRTIRKIFWYQLIHLAPG